MLRSDAGVVKTGGDGVNGSNLSVLILAEVGLHTVENAERTSADGGCGLLRVDASSGSLKADEPYLRMGNEVIESADGVGTAAHAGEHSIRKASFFFHDLLFDLFGDDGLEVTDDGREGMGAHAGA